MILMVDLWFVRVKRIWVRFDMNIVDIAGKNDERS
jgi:hypothetical protein